MSHWRNKAFWLGAVSVQRLVWKIVVWRTIRLIKGFDWFIFGYKLYIFCQLGWSPVVILIFLMVKNPIILMWIRLDYLFLELLKIKCVLFVWLAKIFCRRSDWYSFIIEKVLALPSVRVRSYGGTGHLGQAGNAFGIAVTCGCYAFGRGVFRVFIQSEMLWLINVINLYCLIPAHRNSMMIWSWSPALFQYVHICSVGIFFFRIILDDRFSINAVLVAVKRLTRIYAIIIILLGHFALSIKHFRLRIFQRNAFRRCYQHFLCDFCIFPTLAIYNLLP